MSEAVPRARRDHDEARTDTGEKGGGAASVGAVVRSDENTGSQIRAGRDQRSLSAGLEIARQENRRPSAGPRAQHEAPIVERTGPIPDARMKDRELQARAVNDLASLQSSYGDPARDRSGGDDARQRVALGSFADPQLSHLDVAEHRTRPTRVIVMIVRQGENLQTAAALRRECGNDDAIAGVEPSVPRGARIHEDRATVGSA